VRVYVGRLDKSVVYATLCNINYDIQIHLWQIPREQ